MKTKEKKSYINALSNAKRVIESQIDFILFILGYFNRAKKQNWNFPHKIEFIKSLGVISPNILMKINRMRNLLEHEYMYPSKDDVENSIDVAELFLDATERITSKIDFFELYPKFSTAPIVLTYDSEKHLFKIESLEDRRNVVIIEEKDPDFLPLLKKYIEFIKKAGM